MSVAASSRYAHRPALDGLRAVAVAAVFAYHADLRGAPGGFLGVDLFFVLSGFLITTLLIREWRDEGAIDRLAFWKRRARRLLPALFAMLAAVLVYGATLADPVEVARLRGDVLATLGYVANWWYLAVGQSYFEEFARPPMLRHTWSLAIEEQFYVVWPLLVVPALRRFGARPVAGAALLGAPIVLSALAMAWLAAPGDPSRAYYGTDTRLHVIGVGVALAFWLERAGARGPARASGIVGVASFAALVAFFTLVDDRDAALYRGGYLAFAIASAGAIAAAASDDRSSWLVRGLAARPSRWLGDRSYGVYLWHWPVIVWLDAERTGLAADGAALLALRVGVTLVVSAASYRWIEQPVRRGALTPRAQWRAAWATSAALVAATLVVSAPSRRDAAAIVAPAADAPRVFLVGDSVTATLVATLRESVRDVAIGGATVMGCGAIAGDRWTADRGLVPRRRACEGWRAEWARKLDAGGPDAALILFGAWDVFDLQIGDARLRVGTPEHARALEQGLVDAIDLLDARGIAVALATVPYMRNVEGRQRSWPERDEPWRVDAVNAVIRRVAQRHAERVTLVDLQAFVCPDGVYREVLHGVRLRRDGVHYSEEGARLVWEWLEPELVALARRARGGA